MGATDPQDILDTLLSAVIRLDDGGRVLALNAAAAELLGVGVRQARGRELIEFLPTDEHLTQLLNRSRETGDVVGAHGLALQIGPPPGRRVLVDCEISPVNGESSGMQLELRRLDRQRVIEEESRLHRQHETQRALVRNLAHEIKNPLGGMRGAAQLLAAELDDDNAREYLDVIVREADRLRDLVDALLGPARPPQKQAANIHAVLEHVAEILSLELPENITWLRDYDPSIPEAPIDTAQLTQVFLNLAGNAVQAMPEGGRLIIRTRIDRQYTLAGKRHRMVIRVDVQDTGSGVPEELAESLFFPLVTGRTAGTGLGLPIAQDIVQRHGGLIEWQSEPGNTVFTVRIPLESSE